MSQKLIEMERDLQNWESELNMLNMTRNILSTYYPDQINLTETNEIIKKREDIINEAKCIINAYKLTLINNDTDDLPPAYEENNQ